MSSEKIEQAAQLMADAWINHKAESLPENLRPSSRAEAYAMQDAMARKLGLAVAGWKLGMTAPETMRKNNVTEPVPGRIFRECLYDDGASVAVGGYNTPKLEPEFAVRLKYGLPPRPTPYTRVDIEEATDTILLCFEIADNRLAESSSNPLCNIADNGGFAAYVIGPEVPDWRERDFKAMPVNLLIDGKLAAEGLTGDGRIDPIDVVLWTANSLSQRSLGLAAGDLISTGSATIPTPMGAGSESVAQFEGCGEVKVRFVD